MGSLSVTPAVHHTSPHLRQPPASSNLNESMAWTWTGYDHDAVHRFKEDNFFQTGRNLAEDRFWKTQIHGSDRRGTQSSISLGETGSVNSNDYHQRFHYSYSEPRERSNSVISTMSSRMKQFAPTRDYCYQEEISQSEEEKKAEVDENSAKNCQESKDANVEEEEKKEEEKEEEEVKAADEVSKEESPCNECHCPPGSSEERSLSPVTEEKEVITEKTGEDDKNYKSNSIKISTQKNHIIAEKHISSRFY